MVDEHGCYFNKSGFLKFEGIAEIMLWLYIINSFIYHEGNIIDINNQI